MSTQINIDECKSSLRVSRSHHTGGSESRQRGINVIGDVEGVAWFAGETLDSIPGHVLDH